MITVSGSARAEAAKAVSITRIDINERIFTHFFQRKLNTSTNTTATPYLPTVLYQKIGPKIKRFGVISAISARMAPLCSRHRGFYRNARLIEALFLRGIGCPFVPAGVDLAAKPQKCEKRLEKMPLAATIHRFRPIVHRFNVKVL